MGRAAPGGRDGTRVGRFFVETFVVVMIDDGDYMGSRAFIAGSEAIVIYERELMRGKGLDVCEIGEVEQLLLWFFQSSEAESVDVFCTEIKVVPLELDERYRRFLVYFGLYPCICDRTSDRVEICIAEVSL